MINSFNALPDAYEVVQEEYIKEVKSYAGLLKHKKTGARIVILSNDDNNKVFNIGFRTPPTDSTGVPHILEHSVLCGSKEFPVKDPFVELVKGSLNTFLNAMTYPDKTLYPVASCNDKDFQNLMHVYLDAVFYPNIYQHEEIFQQEGWHYELESEEGELTYNGVVYNEMKGAFSSPEQILFRKITSTLFPDTTYSVESGGDPDYITDLTYEEFLDFHKRYYHPSNSYIYLYGDFDVNEKLQFIEDKYLSQFEYLKVDSEIGIQQPFKQMEVVKEVYPISDTESEDENTYLSYNVVIENSLDRELYLSFQILSYVLMSAPGAPLKKALVESGIAKDVFGEYDNSVIQPYLSIIGKNCDQGQEEHFIEIIRETLQKLIKNGIESRSLEGAINYYEFKFKEADYGRYPSGLMYGLKIMDSWLYDEEKPFIHLKANDTFEILRSKIGTGYFEALVEKYMLHNSHASLLILEPKKGLNKQAEEALAKKLADYKASLSHEEKLGIIEATQSLKAYQDEPSSQEDLQRIPMLAIDDIEKVISPLTNEEIDYKGTKILRHNIDTNGIGYLKFLFDTSYVPEELIPYLGLLSNVFGNIDTENYTYTQLTDETNIHTGGIHTDTNVYGLKENIHAFLPKFEVTLKALFPQMQKAIELAGEIVFTSKLDDTKRLREIIAQLKSRMQMYLNSNGHVVAATRAASYFSESTYYKELLSGVEFYRFIEKLDKDFDTINDEITANLKKVSAYVFRPENLLVDYTANDEGYEVIKDACAAFASRLSNDAVETKTVVFDLKNKREAFITSGMVQYDAVAGNFVEKGFAYHGGLNVLKVIMNYDYLWNNLRVKGGAYGCMSSFSMTGTAYFASYRDPNLKETYDVYRGAADYLRNFTVSDRDMTKYIIGAVSSIDTPLSPAGKGARSLGAYLSGSTHEDIQRSRTELLSTTQETIRSFADLVNAFVEDDCVCVVGSETQIKNNEQLFGQISPLFN